jgi:(2Fe-2S) ferredoxin
MIETHLSKLAGPGDLEALRSGLAARRDPQALRVRICMTGCRAQGAEEVLKAFEAELARRGLGERVSILATGCHGFCALAPVLVVDPTTSSTEGHPADVPEIVESSLLAGQPVERLLYAHPGTGEKIQKAAEVPFYKEQVKIVLRNCGLIDPRDIRQYIERNGYAAAAKALSAFTPSRWWSRSACPLRAVAGRGFPPGASGPGPAPQSQPKYLVCNADEGDPGAFMDRAVLEGDPHSVLEGMLLGAYAIGATDGIVYVRAEYPIAVEHLKIAIAQAGELGLLGENILGTGFSFRVKIKKGSGAFVCGEETALMASIEGRRGMPRPRPPFPAQPASGAGQPASTTWKP